MTWSRCHVMYAHVIVHAVHLTHWDDHVSKIIRRLITPDMFDELYQKNYLFTFYNRNTWWATYLVPARKRSLGPHDLEMSLPHRFSAFPSHGSPGGLFTPFCLTVTTPISQVAFHMGCRRYKPLTLTTLLPYSLARTNLIGLSFSPVE